MSSWHLEMLGKASADVPPEECFSRIAAQAAELGFEYCAHGLRLPVPITRPRTVMHSNYPPLWLSRYRDQGYMEIDPTVSHGMRSSAPVVWSDAFFAGVPHLWKEAQSHGLRFGWAQSRRDPEGTYSLLVLARSKNVLGQEELARSTPRMQWLLHASHECMKASCTDPGLVQPAAGLSDREIDILRWTAEGKTAAELAEILKISERTVNFHINNAVSKLGVCNKTSAAVRAAMLGLLW
jgi:LuxR family transcriptional regulator, quorum-sensing system regulator SolR